MLVQNSQAKDKANGGVYMAKIDDLIKVERLEYYKAWRAANPDKIKQHNQNYWRKRAERRLYEQLLSENNGTKNAEHNTE